MLAVFVTDGLLLCAALSLFVVVTARREPLVWFHEYPYAVRERLRSLPAYQGRLPGIGSCIAQRGVATACGAAMLAVAAAMAPVHGFRATYHFCLGLWLAVDAYSFVVLRMVWFRHSPITRPAGTEDLAGSYAGWAQHWRGFWLAAILGVPASLAAAGIVSLLR